MKTSDCGQKLELIWAQAVFSGLHHFYFICSALKERKPACYMCCSPLITLWGSERARKKDTCPNEPEMSFQRSHEHFFVVW